MIPALQQIIDFDGALVTAGGQHTPATCKVVLPDATWQPVDVSISLSQSGRIIDLETPFSMSGEDRYGRKVNIRDIHYHEINFELNRSTGLAEMNIQLIGEIEVIHGGGNTQRERKVNLSISDAMHLRAAMAISVDFKPETQIEDLFSLTLPEVGKANFLRQWRFWRNADNVTSKGGCSFILELEDASNVPDLATAAVVLRRALVVPSIFIRQRIAVNGWEEQGTSTIEVIQQPLTPITPKSYAIEPHQYVVDKPRLMELTEKACLNFSRLSDPLKSTIEKISMGLVPYINLDSEERFRAMFYGLESCRKYASKKPSDEVIQAKNEVLAALQEAKKNTDGPAAERIQGFIRSVESGPQVDLRIQLEEVLTKWQVVTHDLWPIHGSDTEPGLKNIRDKLSHSGGTAVNGDSLVIATYHLSILVERIVLAILEISLDETKISAARLRSDPWCTRAIVQAARRDAFKKD